MSQEEIYKIQKEVMNLLLKLETTKAIETVESISSILRKKNSINICNKITMRR